MNATSKLVKAWESKNAKNAARAGGISLMALSLAACGGSSDTGITQAQLDAEKAAATAAEAKAAAAAAAQAAAEADAATAAAAQAAAEADAATAAAAQAAAEAAKVEAEAAQAAAEAAQAAAEAAAAAPKSVAFTASLDNLVGGSGDDVFNGVYYADGGTGTTAFPGDTVTGGAGTDTVNISVAGLSTLDQALSGMTFTGVEVVLVTNYDTNATDTEDTSVDTSLMSGLTEVGLFASSATGDTAFTGLAQNVAAQMRNGAGDLDLTYVSTVVVGADDTQTLAVSNVSAGTFTSDGIENITINSTLAKSVVTDVVSDKLKTVKITGDKDLTVSNSIDFAATADGTGIDGTINAADFTGKLSVKATTAQTIKVTGGSKDDTIDVAATLTKNDVIDGGDGTDTLVIEETANRTFADNQLTSIEVLQVGVKTNNIADLDVKALADTTDISLMATTTDKDVTVNNLGAGQDVTITNDSANTLEFGNIAVNLEDDTSTTADAMTVNLVAKTDADQTLDLLTVDSGSEALTLNVSGATGTANEYTVTSVIADGAKEIDVTGAGNFIMTLDQTGTNVTTKVDAGSATGTFGYTDGVANDMTIVGSAGQNTIALGTSLNNKDTITGGASTKDSLSATVGTATTATTGKFNITGVETLALTSTDGQTATVDYASITGVTNTTIAASSTTGDGVLNVTNVANGAKFSTTEQATNDFDGTLNITLADATAADNSVTIALDNDTSIDNFLLTTTDVETVNLVSAAAVNEHVIDVAGVNATKFVLTGGEADKSLSLNGGSNKLNKSVTEIDASAFKGDVILDASVTDSVGVNFKMGDLVITTTTGDAVVGSGATTTDDTLSGNFAASDTTAEFTQFSAIEHYDYTFGASVAITAATNDGIGDGDNVVETVKLSGGNSETKYTAASAIDGTAFTSFDASGLGGEITINVAGSRMDDLTIKGSTASAKDAVTYSAVNGLTATTGKATLEGVETVILNTATAASTIDTSAMTGLKTIAVENDQDVTLTGVASGVAIQLGANATAGTEDYTGTLTIKLADTTSTSDSVTIQTVASGTDDDVDAVLVMAGVEKTTLKISDTGTSADVQLGIAGLDSAEIIVTGGDASEELDLTNGGTTLSSATTTSIDASAFKGIYIASAAANTATTFAANGGAVATLTGSTGNDTFTVGKTAAVTHVIDGGAGNDTYNVTLGTGTTAMTSMEGVEVYNLTAASDAGAIVVTAGASKFFNDTMVQSVSLSGGTSTTTFDSGTDGVDSSSTLTLFDASGFAGKINDLLFDADQLSATVTVKGGASTADLVTATFDNDQTIKMEGIEKLAATFTADKSIDVGTYVTGLTTVTVASDNGSAAAIATLTNVAAGTTVELITNEANDGLTIVQATTSGTESQSIKLLANDAGEAVLFDMANVETLNIEMGTGSADTDLSLANFDMDTAGQTNAVVVTGALNLDLIALSIDTTSINASAMTAGGVDVSGRTNNVALTFVGADAGAESVQMINAGDTLNGGEKASVLDSLDIDFASVLGGIAIDLSAADNVVSMNGSANAAVQTGFENVDVSGYTGFGASITGNDEANTVTGTASTDQISLGSGDDIINVTSTAASANDVMDGGAGTGDTIHILATTDFADTDANITNIEKVTMANGTITVDLTGQSEGFTITGGTGDDTITGGTGIDTITSGTGEDTFVIALSTGADVITDISTGANSDAFAAASIEAITTEDTTFAKLAAGAAVYDVGVTAGVISAAVDVANAATMSVTDVNTLLITTLSKTITAASDGEKAVLLVSTDYDSALVDTYMYVIEHDGTDIDGVTLLGTLQTVELDNLSATNFDGFA